VGGVKVARYFMVLRGVTGRREESVKLEDGATVEELLKILVERYKEKLEGWIRRGKAGEGLRLLFFMNGQNIESLSGFKTELNDRDVFRLLLRLLGG